jgi:DNA polymerase III delta prime subunit
MSKQHTLYVEKYRPSKLEDYVGDTELKANIDSFIKSNDIINLCLHGPAGTGKTTLAKILVNSIDCDYILLNASDERGIDAIRDKVQKFASTASFKPIKIVILDEADYITPTAQGMLRNLIEAFSLKTRFILTCNHIDKISDPIQSRCQVVKIIPPTKQTLVDRTEYILKQEGVKYDPKNINLIVEVLYPDLRKILNTCQLSSKTGELILDKKLLLDSNYKLNILKELKTPTYQSINSVRQIIADSGISDFDDLFRFLYENVDTFAKGKEGEVFLILSEMQYQSGFRIDKEINIMSTIYQIIQIIK